MSALFVMSTMPTWCRVAAVPLFRGRQHFSEAGPLSLGRLESDSLGSVLVTLTNVSIGSRWRVELLSDGTLAASPNATNTGVAASSTVVLTLDYYAAGNSNNDVRIKVRGGSAVSPRVKDYLTQVALGPAAQSVFIAQVQDE